MFKELIIISDYSPNFNNFLTSFLFSLSAFTEEYPNKPPSVKFVSKMFHPNVYADGGTKL